MSTVRPFRVRDPKQEGSLIRWSDALFQQVEYVQPAPAPLYEPIPLPETTELQWPVLDEETRA